MRFEIKFVVNGWIGVCQKMKKVMPKNCGNKQDLFVSGDRIQEKFDLTELQIKVSSVTPFTFNAVELCVVTINEKPWTRARDVCRALKYGKATKAADVVRHLCGRENHAHKWQLKRFLSETKPVDWPKDSQKYDIYTNEERMYELLFSSQQPKAKDLRRHCCNVLFPHVQQQLSDKSHAMEIEDLTGRIQASEFTNEAHQQTIEEKDTAITLLNDDLQNREHEHVALQAQRNVYQAQLQRCQDTIIHPRTC